MAGGPTLVGARNILHDSPQDPNGQQSPIPYPVTLHLGDGVPPGLALQDLLGAFLQSPVFWAITFV